MGDSPGNRKILCQILSSGPEAYCDGSVIGANSHFWKRVYKVWEVSDVRRDKSGRRIEP